MIKGIKKTDSVKWCGHVFDCDLLSKAVFFAVSLSLMQVTFASNTTTNGVAARAESMQAFTAVADDSSSVFYNPAGLTTIEGTEIYNTIIILNPAPNYSNSFNDVTSKSRQTIPAGSLFISTDKFSKFSFGFGIYSPFARSTSYKTNEAVYNHRQASKLLRLDAAPTLAYELSPEISLGAGIVGSRVTMTTNILGLKQNAVGYGYTANGGLLIKLPNKVNLGLTYRGSESVKMDGTGKFAGIKDDFHNHFDFPGVASLGASWATNDKLLLSFAYDYEMWSKVKKIHNEYSNPVLEAVGGTVVLDGMSKGTYRLGMQYKIREQDQLYAGYSYAPRVIPKNNIIPATPDYDTHFFSIGASHYYENWRFDISYEHDVGEEFTNHNVFFPGEYSAHNNVILLGITYTFPAAA